MLFLLPIITTFCAIIRAQWISPLEPTLPQAKYDIAIGSLEETITLIYEKSIVEYHITNKSFVTLSDTLPVNIMGQGQYYTQIDTILYIMDAFASASKIHIYDLSSKQLTVHWNNIAIPPTATEYRSTGCMASTNNALYIVGGGSGHSGSTVIAEVHIFNLTTSMWSSAPSLKQRRAYFGCIVHSATNTLYSVGGWFGLLVYSIEYISVIDIEHNTWDYLADTLSWRGDNNRLVADDRYLYSVGSGEYVAYTGGYLAYVYVIDTLTKRVQLLSDKLVYGARMFAPIFIHHRLYAFGGQIYQWTPSNRYQYIDLNMPQIEQETNYSFNVTVNLEFPSAIAVNDIVVVVEHYISNISTVTANCSELMDIEGATDSEQIIIHAVITTCNPQTLDALLTARRDSHLHLVESIIVIENVRNVSITAESTTSEVTTEEPTTNEPTTNEPTVDETTTSESTTTEPTVDEATTSESTTTTEPTADETTTSESTTSQGTTSEPEREREVDYDETEQTEGEYEPSTEPIHKKTFSTMMKVIIAIGVLICCIIVVIGCCWYRYHRINKQIQLEHDVVSLNSAVQSSSRIGTTTTTTTTTAAITNANIENKPKGQCHLEVNRHKLQHSEEMYNNVDCMKDQTTKGNTAGAQTKDPEAIAMEEDEYEYYYEYDDNEDVDDIYGGGTQTVTDGGRIEGL